MRLSAMVFIISSRKESDEMNSNLFKDVFSKILNFVNQTSLQHSTPDNETVTSLIFIT